ncbi:MAG: hypothetical protein Q9219_007020 [cf. Caloplaca sp. 3 TL-2023]
MASAAVSAVGIAMIVDRAPADRLGSTLGIIGMSIATAVIVGPIIGGFLYRYVGYHAVFALSYALLALDIILRLLLIEDVSSRRGTQGEIGLETDFVTHSHVCNEGDSITPFVVARRNLSPSKSSMSAYSMVPDKAEASSNPERYGEKGAIAQANSLRSCVFALGIAAGPLLSGFLRDGYGWTVMSLILGCISAAAAPLTYFWLGGDNVSKKGDPDGREA